ncbi:MAG: hypothetical protein Q7R50_03345, partial [Dehalococcoidales bacterium]|nr:hypothetical protein [Dehalococcoidales bacterium]
PPGGMGKIPLQHDYVLSQKEDELILKNYQGKIFSYRNPVLPRPVSARVVGNGRAQQLAFSL